MCVVKLFNLIDKETCSSSVKYVIRVKKNNLIKLRSCNEKQDTTVKSQLHITASLTTNQISAMGRGRKMNRERRRERRWESLWCPYNSITAHFYHMICHACFTVYTDGRIRNMRLAFSNDI